MAQKNRQLIFQIVFFIFVGGVTLLIDIGVSTLLFHVFHIPAYMASAVGFLSGFIFNFPMNRKKVFHHSVHDRFTLKTQIFFYITLCLFNLVTTSFLVDVLVTHNILAIEYAKIPVTLLIAIWNFLTFRLYIFSKKSENSSMVKVSE